MSYQEKTLKKSYNGKELVPLSVGKEILDIREEIESNHQHAGPQLELVYKAYCEIQEGHGHHPSELRPACSGCTKDMNKMLSNWFKLYDKGSLPQRARAGGVKHKPLVAVKAKTEPKKVVKVAKDLSNQGEGKKEFKKPTEFKEASKMSNNKVEMSYGEMLTEFEKTASEKEQKEINTGNKPKKAQLVAYFNNK